ncbi:hypothetical protein BK662_21950 [Pseudomonas frederiksbergensis]|uniref:Uncharacterized protein n=1 Tax=Pseudomonas frederiksbergensis TaxID=104087 RepID=A0A423HKU1_9PSED|nr:hypothetical protein BK662_20745 [Pseudomonas frederiksbergensis]RON13804.1 hypothetical protein BK662_21950 [Pseudomonas frederiksbergensis]
MLNAAGRPLWIYVIAGLLSAHFYIGSEKLYVSGMGIYEGLYWMQKRTFRTLSILLEEGCFDAVQKLIGFTRFRQIGNQRRRIGAKGREGFRVSSDEYSGNVKAHRDELLMKLKTAHSRHLDIGYKATCLSGAIRVEKLQSAAISLNFVTAGSQQAFKRCPDRIIIVDDGDNH